MYQIVFLHGPAEFDSFACYFKEGELLSMQKEKLKEFLGSQKRMKEVWISGFSFDDIYIATSEQGLWENQNHWTGRMDVQTKPQCEVLVDKLCEAIKDLPHSACFQSPEKRLKKVLTSGPSDPKIVI